MQHNQRNGLCALVYVCVYVSFIQFIILFLFLYYYKAVKYDSINVEDIMYKEKNNPKFIILLYY